MHRPNWLRGLKLTTSQVKSLTTVSNFTQLSPDLSQFYSNNYSTDHYFIEYNGFLSNHISHAMLALNQLEVPSPTIKSYMNWYNTENKLVKKTDVNSSQLQPDSTAGNDNNSDISFDIGERKHFYGIYNTLEKELESTKHKNNTDSLISDKFPLFSSGMSGSLLHGLIHLGYGVSANNKEMILEGLSYLPHSSLNFDINIDKISSMKGIDGNMNMIDVLREIKKDGKLLGCVVNNYNLVKDIPLGKGQQPLICLSKYGQDLIHYYVSKFINTVPLITAEYKVSRSASNDTNNEFDKQLDKLKEYLMSTMISLYTFGDDIFYNDFVLLHGVTGVWSLCNILSKLTNREDINQCAMQFICVAIATYVITFEVDIERGLKQVKEYESEIFTRGVNDHVYRYLIAEIVYNIKLDLKNGVYDDEHVYKLIGAVLDCLDNGYIDVKTAYYAISKAAEYPLKIKTVYHEVENIFKEKSKL